MIKTKKDIETVLPKKQTSLYGYKDQFNVFLKLFENGKMPNSILFSGLKGLGKATFAYHIINYLLSKEGKKKYLIDHFQIQSDNLDYNLLNNNTHPNFYLVEKNVHEKEIKIEQIRNLLKFINKSTYSRDLKIIMIDDSEFLNLNSSNALLKAIEEPENNTFFFIIHNSAHKILDTIKSRCTEFKFFFAKSEKKNIFRKIVNQYKVNCDIESIDENFYFETPGNIIKYLLISINADIDITKNELSSILYFIEKYKNEKKEEILPILSLFIQKFYHGLLFNNNKNLNH